jgi:hypothetical protein
MRLRPSVVMSFLAAFVSAVALVPAAQAEVSHRTGVGIKCEWLPIEGPTESMRCEATVLDGSSEPTPPTGIVTSNGSITCALAAVSAARSACAFTLTAPSEGEATVTSEYSGDATHTSAYLRMGWLGNEAYVGRVIWVEPSAPNLPPSPPPPSYVPAAPKNESKSLSPTPTPLGPPSSTAKNLGAKIDLHPAKRSRQRLARFRFAGAGRFECKLDLALYKSCAASFKRRVETGAHVLHVRPFGGGRVTTFRWRVLPGR